MKRTRLWSLSLVLPVVLVACANTTQTFEQSGLRVQTLRRNYANIHLVSQGERHVLIDSGHRVGAEELVADLKELGVEPSAIQAVVISHGHYDHAGGAEYLRREHGVKVIAGAGDRKSLEGGKHTQPFCPTDGWAESRLEDDSTQEFDPTQVDIWLDDAPLDLSEPFGIPAKVVPLPGHTAGSLVVVSKGLAFVGDLLRGALIGGGAVVHFYNCDLTDNRADIRRLLDELAPTAAHFFPGHFGRLDREDLEDLWAEMGEP